jgi:hypothetical protein
VAAAGACCCGARAGTPSRAGVRGQYAAAHYAQQQQEATSQASSYQYAPKQ